MGEPYYSDDSVTLYHGDCREVDAWLTADVLVTDPPYGMAFVSNYASTKRPIVGDDSTWIRDDALAKWGGGSTCGGVWDVEGSSPGRCCSRADLGQDRWRGAWHG